MGERHEWHELARIAWQFGRTGFANCWFSPGRWVPAGRLRLRNPVYTSRKLVPPCAERPRPLDRYHGCPRRHSQSVGGRRRKRAVRAACGQWRDWPSHVRQPCGSQKCVQGNRFAADEGVRVSIKSLASRGTPGRFAAYSVSRDTTLTEDGCHAQNARTLFLSNMGR